jgi:hypothetical protein
VEFHAEFPVLRNLFPLVLWIFSFWINHITQFSFSGNCFTFLNSIFSSLCNRLSVKIWKHSLVTSWIYAQIPMFTLNKKLVISSTRKGKCNPYSLYHLLIFTIY